MKEKLRILLFLLVGMICYTHVNAQTTYANREWVEETPVVGSGHYHTSTIVVSGNLYITGNVVNGSGNTDIYTLKLDTNGDTLWSATYNGSAGGDDYGVEIKYLSGNIWVVGAAKNTSTGYDFCVLKYNATTGAQTYVNNFNGAGNGDDIPTSILVESSAVYVCGGSEATNGLSDFAVNKLNFGPGGTWTKYYDYNNLHDGATSIVSGGTNVIVTGGSAAAIGDWDIATLKIHKLTGSMSTTRTDITGATMVEANAMTTDSLNNLYITGNAIVGGEKNIQTVKLDSNLALVWIRDYSGNDDDDGKDIGIDNSGNVYVTGYSEQSNGANKGVLIKYAANGDTLFTKFYGNTETEDGVQFRKMAVESSGIYLTGSSGAAGLNSFAFVKFDASGNLRLAREYQADSLDDDGFEIGVDGDDVYITGFTETIAGRRMTTIKYSLQERDMSIQDDDSVMYAKRNLIVRVDPSLINTAEIDNGTREFWTMDELFTGTLPDDIRDSVATTCGTSNCRITVYKIFKHLKTTDSTTISRLGETIVIPDFWATFVFEFPDGVNVIDAEDDLETLFPSISYTHLNYVATMDTPADDDLYNDQMSLYPVTNYSDSAHINVEEAWDYETGQSFVRCGVFDTGILYSHEDLGTSIVVGGWDFFDGSGTDLYSSSNPAPDGHGTKSSGVIGANRNNDTGVAGIAGGDDDLAETGVSLYSMTILDPATLTATLDYIVDAVVMSSIYDPGADYGFGFHMSNNSWSIKQGDPFFSYNHTLLIEAYHFANKAKVTVVATRGSTFDPMSNDQAYPSMLDDDWILNVTSTGTDGHRMDGINTNSANEGGCYGFVEGDIDVGAPGATGLIMTTSFTSTTSYSSFSCTSAAAPHVSGVVALLMSYHNQPFDDYNNLAPEDCEMILQKTAVDVDDVGYDDLSGWGRIDAGQAIKFIADPCHLDHYGTDVSPNTKSYTQVDSMVPVYLIEKFELTPGVWINQGNYKCNVYKIDATITHPTMSINDTIRAVWPRQSSSTLWGYYENVGATNYLTPRERVAVDAYDDSTCFMHGFVYEVYTNAGAFLGWWPFNLTLSQAELAYTVVRCDTSYITTEVVENEMTNSVQVYPNPASTEQSIKIQLSQPAEVSVQLYDQQGRLVGNVYSGYVYAGEIVVNSGIEHLPSGMYIYQVMIGEELKHVKFIKQ
jgi:hypothetical protein